MKNYLIRLAMLLDLAVILLAKFEHEIDEWQEMAKALIQSPDAAGLTARSLWLATVSFGLVIGIGLSSLLALLSWPKVEDRRSVRMASVFLLLFLCSLVFSVFSRRFPPWWF